MTKVIHIITIMLSLVTATGVFIHDTGIDKLAFSIGNRDSQRTSLSVADLKLATDPHVHPEHSSRNIKNLSYRTPSIPPRENKTKRYLTQNAEPRGRHAFDNYSLPVVA